LRAGQCSSTSGAFGFVDDPNTEFATLVSIEMAYLAIWIGDVVVSRVPDRMGVSAEDVLTTYG
jgi:hypothetical protein